MVLRRLHLAVAVLGFVVFVLTGQFMDRQLDHLVGMDLGPRALYRSSHIYLLLCSLVHGALGLYLEPMSHRIARGLQWVGSMLLVAALGGFVYGFFVETPLGEIERAVIRLSIYGCLAGVVVHGVSRGYPTTTG